MHAHTSIPVSAGLALGPNRSGLHTDSRGFFKGDTVGVRTKRVKRVMSGTRDYPVFSSYPMLVHEARELPRMSTLALLSLMGQ